MGLITKPFTFTSGTIANPDEVNANFDALYAAINGNLNDDNIASISGSKITIGVTDSSVAPAATGNPFDTATNLIGGIVAAAKHPHKGYCTIHFPDNGIAPFATRGEMAFGGVIIRNSNSSVSLAATQAINTTGSSDFTLSGVASNSNKIYYLLMQLASAAAVINITSTQCRFSWVPVGWNGTTTDAVYSNTLTWDFEVGGYVMRSNNCATKLAIGMYYGTTVINGSSNYLHHKTLVRPYSNWTEKATTNAAAEVWGFSSTNAHISSTLSAMSAGDLTTVGRRYNYTDETFEYYIGGLLNSASEVATIINLPPTLRTKTSEFAHARHWRIDGITHQFAGGQAGGSAGVSGLYTYFQIGLEAEAGASVEIHSTGSRASVKVIPRHSAMYGSRFNFMLRRVRVDEFEA